MAEVLLEVVNGLFELGDGVGWLACGAFGVECCTVELMVLVDVSVTKEEFCSGDC